MASHRAHIVWLSLSVIVVLAAALVSFLLLRQDRPEPDRLADPGALSRPSDPVPDPIEDQPELEEPPLPLISLVGTVVASDPRWSRASVADNRPGGKTRVYSLGDTLPDGSRLVGIRSSLVVTRHDGKRRILRLDKQAAHRRKPDHEENLQGVQRTGTDRFRVDRQTLLEQIGEPENLLRDVRVTLAFDPKLGIEGMRLDFQAPDPFLGRLGLQDGDVVHRVGSVIIDGPDRMNEIADLLRKAREADIEFTRDGTLRTLRYILD